MDKANQPDAVTPTVTDAAWPFFGYAPGSYMATCLRCGETKDDLDKRAISCLECAVIASKQYSKDQQALLATHTVAPADEPIPMLLFCPNCGQAHVDAPEDGFHEGDDAQSGAFSEGWTNPPHRSHLCHDCGCIWRPADVPTEGVASIKTVGKADTWTPERGNAERAVAPADEDAEAVLSSLKSWITGLPHDLESRPQVLADLTRIAERLASKGADDLREAAEFAHRTLVEQKIARILREDARAGGAADLISKVVNKLRAALSPPQATGSEK